MKQSKAVVAVFMLAVLTACSPSEFLESKVEELKGFDFSSIEEVIHDVPTQRDFITYENPPVPRPNLITSIFAGDKRGTCFPIGPNTVVTAYHVLRNEEDISVNYYPAYVIYYDDIKDVAVLTTVWEFVNFYDVAEPNRAAFAVGDKYVDGDSGMPLLTKTGEVGGMLIGERRDATYAVVGVAFLSDLEQLIIDFNVRKEMRRSGIETESSAGEDTVLDENWRTENPPETWSQSAAQQSSNSGRDSAYTYRE